MKSCERWECECESEQRKIDVRQRRRELQVQTSRACRFAQVGRIERAGLWQRGSRSYGSHKASKVNEGVVGAPSPGLMGRELTLATTRS